MKIKLLLLSGLLSGFTSLIAQTKKAMIRLEDVGPGGYYETVEGCNKLKAIADYLYSENVPFQIAMIPRFKNPGIGVDHSIADLTDPVSVRFVQTIKYCRTKGASIGIHGYTHQFNNSISGAGFEFYAGSACSSNCPPDDISSSMLNKTDFDASQVSIKLKAAFEAAAIADIKVDWFETPHYTASYTQVQLIESCSGVIYEHFDNNVKLLNTQGEDIFSNGTLYISTPLNYIADGQEQTSVNDMCAALSTYTSADIASFFFHPYLDFNFIPVNSNGTVLSYASNSYLHQLINCFKSQSFSFAGITTLYNFIPSKRQTNIERSSCNLLIGDVTGDGVSELIFWNSATGKWEVSKNTLVRPPLRVQADFTTTTYLNSWAVGTIWQPLVGDLDGDQKKDVFVYNSLAGEWQVALSNGTQFTPHAGSAGNYKWLNGWGIGSYWKPLVGDFNGDEKDDVVLYNNTDGDWQVALSSGSALVPNSGGSGNSHWLYNWGIGSSWQPLVGDFDGNGKDDVVLYDNINGGWQVALSNGSSLVPNAGATGNYLWLNGWGGGSQWKPLVGNFNGDDKSDIMVVDLANGDWQISLSNGSSFLPSGTPFMNWGKYTNALPFTGTFTSNGKSSILLWNKDLYNGTIDFALSNVGVTNGSERLNAVMDIASADLHEGTLPLLYPNPTKDELNIIFNSTGVKSISIYNTMGQLLQQAETPNNFMLLNLSTYESGVYFIHISTSQGIVVQKFIHD